MRSLTTTAEGPGAAAPPRALRWSFLAVVVAIYGGAILYLDGLSFDRVKDEEQFWDQVQAFVRTWPPDLEALRSYHEPMTPLAFLLWAGLETWHHLGIAAARCVTVVASLAVLAIIALQRPAPGARPETPVLAAVGLLLYPYWFPTSLLVYTDVPATLFVVGGLLAYVRGHHLASAALFVVAIATRQYMFTFPAAIFAFEAVEALRKRRVEALRWLPYAVAASSLGAWYAFFGGFSPAPSLEKWPRHTNALLSIHTEYALYALAAVGAYFVVVELVLDRRWQRTRLRLDYVQVSALLVAMVLFAIFTPYYPEAIGPLNRALQYLLGDGGVAQGIRIGLLLGFVCATVLRFAGPGLGSWVVLANVAIMPFVWSPWEKYYMPTLAALWFLKATGELDAPSPAVAEAEAEPRATRSTVRA